MSKRLLLCPNLNSIFNPDLRLHLRSCALALALAFATPAMVLAQYPPAGIPGGAPQGGFPAGGQPQGVAAQGVRIDRLENRVRELTGQVEELQFKLQRMETLLQKFQQDVDFRFQERGGAGAPPAARQQPQPQRRSDARPPAGAPAQPAQLPPDPDDDQTPGAQAGGVQPNVIPAPGDVPQARPRGRNDAFDPDNNPAAPGAPRPLASNPGPYVPSAAARRALPGGPLDPGAHGEPGAPEDPNAPLDLSRRGGPVRPAAVAQPPQPGPAIPGPAVAAPNYPGVLPGVPGQQMNPGAPAAAPQPQDRYKIALAAIKENRFDEAEQDLRAFIDQNPKSRNLADAVFNLGVTYERRSRHREAAEQFLKVTQTYDKAYRAPESMLRLGLSLEKLGAREQACATWQEAGRKYPLAPNYVRTGLERQMKRAQC